ncbi:MAG: hypothetical protein ACK6A8_16870, partial [Planctomycetota bacterium]
TMADYVNAEHIRAFINAGDVEILDSTVSTAAERHLEQSFPLRSYATIIDWDKIPSAMLEWNTVSDEEALNWAMTTTIGENTFGLLLYDPYQPCLIGPLDFMLRHLDELVWKAPGCRFLFGVERDEVGRIIFGNGIVEFNGKGELFATADA